MIDGRGSSRGSSPGGHRGQDRRRAIGDPDPAFEPLDAGQCSAGGVVGGRDEQPRHHQFQVQPRRGRAGHLGQRAVDHVSRAGELGRAERDRLQAHSVQLVLRDAAQHRRRRVAACRHDDEVTQAFEQVFDETPRILAGLDDTVNTDEGGPGIHRSECVDDLVEECRVRVAEQRDGPLVFDGTTLGASDELVEEREGVTYRATACAHDERQHSRLHRDLLGLAQLREVVEHLRWRNESERVVVGATADRTDDLLGLGRREDELDMIRRLLDQFEQRVETLRSHHVRLVEDENLVAISGRGERGTLTQVASIIHSVVASGVNLDHIERATTVARELDAARALSARGVGRTLSAVEAAGQDARACRLAAAARAAEEIRVIDPVGAQRRAERIRHLRLTDQLGERLRPITAVEGGDHLHRVVGAPDPGWPEEKEDPPRTRQSPVTLAAFPLWGSWPGWRHAGSRAYCMRRRFCDASRAGSPIRATRPITRDRYDPCLATACERSRRIRLVAYGARLESVLGESPRGFESPILRSSENGPRTRTTPQQLHLA